MQTQIKCMFNYSWKMCNQRSQFDLFFVFVGMWPRPQHVGPILLISLWWTDSSALQLVLLSCHYCCWFLPLLLLHFYFNFIYNLLLSSSKEKNCDGIYSVVCIPTHYRFRFLIDYANIMKFSSRFISSRSFDRSQIALKFDFHNESILFPTIANNSHDLFLFLFFFFISFEII